MKLAKDEMECITKKELQKKYNQDFDEEKYIDACNTTDRELGTDEGIRQESAKIELKSEQNFIEKKKFLKKCIN